LLHAGEQFASFQKSQFKQLSALKFNNAISIQCEPTCCQNKRKWGLSKLSSIFSELYIRILPDIYSRSRMMIGNA